MLQMVKMLAQQPILGLGRRRLTLLPDPLRTAAHPQVRDRLRRFPVSLLHVLQRVLDVRDLLAPLPARRKLAGLRGTMSSMFVCAINM